MCADSSQDRVRLWKLGIAGECGRCLEVKPLTNKKNRLSNRQNVSKWNLKITNEKKVLLCECKRHTNHRVASAHCAAVPSYYVHGL